MAAALVTPSATSDTDPAAAARAAGLRYVNDNQPGIARIRDSDAFRYLDPNGDTVDDPKTLERIEALAIPPAWTDVWICPNPRGHIQATGRDAKGRKQYRYHLRWRAVRDEAKFERMLAFGEALPGIRERTERDLAGGSLRRQRVLAAIVRLLETTLIRVGNEEYARENKSFGLTTLRNRHVDVERSRLRFHFRGKSGKEHSVGLTNRRLATIVRRLQELPGQELFQYVGDDGERHSVESADVNDYLREITGQDFTAKDFRTWAGTVLAARALLECAPCESATQAKKNVVQAIATVAERLGNTPAVCRSCYVHPGIVEAYLEGTVIEPVPDGPKAVDQTSPPQLAGDEAAVVVMLRERLAREATQQKAG